jgi:hypothetical protein
VGDPFDDLTDLEETVDSHEEREQVRQTIRSAMSVQDDHAVFGRVVYGLGWEDLAEALLGSLLFGFPMVVEGGTLEVGKFVTQ